MTETRELRDHRAVDSSFSQIVLFERTNQSHAISLAFLVLGASQATGAVESDAWQFEATPYLFAAGLDGEVGIRGVNSDVDISFSDIVDRLDAGFMGLFTANKGPWTYSLEAVYMKLEDEGAKRVTGPFGRVSISGALKVTTKLSVLQAATLPGVASAFLTRKLRAKLGILRHADHLREHDEIARAHWQRRSVKPEEVRRRATHRRLAA